MSHHTLKSLLGYTCERLLVKFVINNHLDPEPSRRPKTQPFKTVTDKLSSDVNNHDADMASSNFSKDIITPS